MHSRTQDRIAIVGFLAPNFLGFACFLLFPVVLSFIMAFTNWSLKPALGLEFVGLRNFSDLLWVRGSGGDALVLPGYVGAAVMLALGSIGALWCGLTCARGFRLTGLLLAVVGVASLIAAATAGAPPGVWGASVVLIVFAWLMSSREDGDWRPGIALVPGGMVAGAVLLLWWLHGAMWSAYTLRDPRFWQYLYNTVFLMLGIPFTVLGSLGLALLLNRELPTGPVKARAAGAALCVACAVATFVLLWRLGGRDAGALGAVFWLIAAVGVSFNVVAFRTVFYLPTFTAGVALMILWKALYNPKTGPINACIESITASFGHAAQGPDWLQSVAWAKPALIIMGFWIGIGGMNMLLYLAALSNLPQHLLDAAQVDGAGRWARLRHVIWPQLAPTTFFIAIMSVIGGLQGGFEQARVMTLGGPAGATTTLSYYIYNKAFIELDLGYAAAISWILFAVIFVATAINWQYGKDLEVE